MIVFDVRFLRLNSHENCGLSCRYSQLYDSKSEFLFRDRWSERVSREAEKRKTRGTKRNSFQGERLRYWKHAFREDVMRTFGQQWVHYITPRIMQTTMYVRMPSADAAWISSVSYCLVCGHTLKFKAMDDTRAKENESHRNSGRFSFARYFWPVPTLRNSRCASSFYCVFFFLLHRKGSTNKSRKLISLRKLHLLSFLLLLQRQ